MPSTHPPSSSASCNLLAAQLLAYTIHQLFPTALRVQGGLHSLGFYYDIIFEQPINAPILELIERSLRTLIKEDRLFRFHSMMRENAQALFESNQEPFFTFFAGESPHNIVDLIEIDQTFLLCPELPLTSTGVVGVIKLLAYQPHTVSVDQDIVDVIRIIGVSKPDQKALKTFSKNYDDLLKRRDHRLLGIRQELFAFCHRGSDSGYIWRGNGVALINRLAAWLDACKPWTEEKVVTTPFFSFPTQSGSLLDGFDHPASNASSVPSWLLQGHLSLLSQSNLQGKSLPYRLNERGFVFESCPEPQLWGLLGSHVNWVDQTTILSLSSQVVQELISSLHFIEQMFRIFCFEGYWHRVSSRKKSAKAKRETKALEWIESAIAEASLCFPIQTVLEEEVDCIGPRLELRVRDDIGRFWVLAKVEIVQSDSQVFKEFSVQEKNERSVLLSRQVLSFSRLIALLIEQKDGGVPLWLADEQVRIIAIGKTNHRYAESVQLRLNDCGFRSLCDVDEMPLSARIQEAERCGAPFLMFIGDQERVKEKISLRSVDRKEKNQLMSVEAFVEKYYRQTQAPQGISDS